MLLRSDAVESIQGVKALGRADVISGVQRGQEEERSLEEVPRRLWSVSQEERLHQKPAFPDLDLGFLRNDTSVA